MDRIQAKYEQQVMLAARLKELAGKELYGCVNQKDYFITVLRDITENVLEIKKAALEEACARFSARLDGPVTEEEITGFKDVLDKLVSGDSFLYIEAGLAGSPRLLRERLAGLKPLSLAQEESRRALKDPGSLRLVAETCRRLGFDRLEARYLQAVNGLACERTLAKARENVADYCCLYRVPVNREDTLTPFSLSRVDAVAASCYRLLFRLRDITEQYG